MSAAAELLSRLRLGKPVPLESVEPKVGAVLLLRTGLAKFASKGSVALVATERGRGWGSGEWGGGRGQGGRGEGAKHPRAP